MIDRVFLDTNVVVYAYDTHDVQKQRTAQSILRGCIEKENGVLSVQVTGECFNVLTRKIGIPMTTDEALEIIATLEVLPVQEIDQEMVRHAIDTHKRYAIAYWDALIIAAAERARCRSIFSEDLNEGQVYCGIRVENPFKRTSSP